MGSYTMFGRFENPRRCMQARNLTTNVSKILDLKSSSEQIFSKNCRWVPLFSCTEPNASVVVAHLHSVRLTRSLTFEPGV